MGKGSFVVGGEDYEGNINRNIASFQVITRDKSLVGFDVSVNVDHRLFSKEGRQEWKAEKKQEVENFKNVGENVKVASWRVGKSATDLGRAIESGLTNEDVSVLEIGKLYGEAVDRNVNAQKDHKNLVIRDKMNDALGEKGEKSAEDVQTDLRDVANIMREREGAEEGDLYLYEGDELTAENEFDKKGISKKQAKAYHDADNSDIAINVDKTDLTKGSELYGTITEEAVHAGQKARGEVYDSEEGIGGRSEGLAEFANKTASSAWELENKIAGISNESNSLQMDNWRTDNSSSETMLIGLGKAENAQDVQPEVIVSEGTRFSQPGDVGHDPIIHKLNVYSQQSGRRIITQNLPCSQVCNQTNITKFIPWQLDISNICNNRLPKFVDRFFKIFHQKVRESLTDATRVLNFYLIKLTLQIVFTHNIQQAITPNFDIKLLLQMLFNLSGSTHQS